MSKISVFWFRRDLRPEDNSGLFQALKSGFPVLPLFIFDTDILSQLPDKADKRVDLIQQMLVTLDAKLRNFGSSLTVEVGKPMEVFSKLTEKYEIAAVYTNRDYESYSRKRDTEVSDFLQSKNIKFCSFKDQVIFEFDEVLKADGKPYTVFTPYANTWKKLIHNNLLKPFESELPHKNYLQYSSNGVPDLEKIGFRKTGIVFSEPLPDIEIIRNYENTRNFPALVNGTTHLSVHLRFGTISIRKLVGIALKENEIWLNELIWREFFMSILVHFPHVENSSFRREYDRIQWRNNEQEFRLWCEGKTGYPIVDAGMHELNETGLMHNRVRMIVASFLTKHLLIDWRWGEAYFASKLLDYDLSANNGNWQWAAGCGCDAAPYFRVFNPTEQTKKFDPELKYIRRWVNDVDELNYPQPMVEHKFARERALNVYKEGINRVQ